jgi:hypothetical protein
VYCAVYGIRTRVGRRDNPVDDHYPNAAGGICRDATYGIRTREIRRDSPAGDHCPNATCAVFALDPWIMGLMIIKLFAGCAAPMARLHGECGDSRRGRGTGEGPTVGDDATSPAARCPGWSASSAGSGSPGAQREPHVSLRSSARTGTRWSAGRVAGFMERCMANSTCLGSLCKRPRRVKRTFEEYRDSCE